MKASDKINFENLVSAKSAKSGKGSKYSKAVEVVFEYIRGSFDCEGSRYELNIGDLAGATRSAAADAFENYAIDITLSVTETETSVELWNGNAPKPLVGRVTLK